MLFTVQTDEVGVRFAPCFAVMKLFFRCTDKNRFIQGAFVQEVKLPGFMSMLSFCQRRRQRWVAENEIRSQIGIDRDGG